MTISELKRKAHAAGVYGNKGGWISLGQKRVQGWELALKFIEDMRPHLPWNLAEIADGRRIGTPTLCRDVTQEVVAGLISPNPVVWRDSAETLRRWAEIYG